MPGAAASRLGYTLAEATSALALAGLLTLLLAVILSVVGRMAVTHARVSGQADSERAVAAILGGELRALTASDATFHADSVRLRAFRGTGIVCGAGEDVLTVEYRGVRLPEPHKDSVLLIWAGAERAFPLEAASGAAGCASADGAGSLELTTPWRAPASIGAPALALVFETGAYSLAGSAFRYRRGAGGRQPITEENLSDAGSGLARIDLGDGSAAAVVSLRPTGSPSALPMSWSLRMPQGSARPAGLDP